jgi:uncharacterized oxidoreductase
MRSPLSHPSKVVLTGATSGIGAEMLELLLAGGHQVIMLARRARQLEPRNGLDAIDIDLSNTALVKATAADIAARHPDIAMVINNAALQYPFALTDPEFDPQHMIAEVAINLLAPALLSHALLACLRRHGAGAAIVNISSGLAFFPKQQSALYCATKAALHSFSQSLRYQLEADGVAVIEAILPLVETPMTAGRGSGKISSQAAAQAIITGIKMGQAEIFIGKAKLIPLFARFVPNIGRKVLRGS